MNPSSKLSSTSPVPSGAAPDSAVLSQIVHDSADCIKVLDLDARLLSMNPGGQRTMEIDDFSVCQHLLWPDFWTGADRLKVEAALERARLGESSTFEGQTATFKGTPKWWEVRVAPVLNEDGAVRQLLAISRDITARKQAELALNELNADLERQVEERTRQALQNSQAHQAFMVFTEAVGTQTDVTVLAREAVKLLQHHFRDASIGYYRRNGELWTALAWSDDLSPEVVEVITAGVPSEHPVIAEVLAAQGAVFDYAFLRAAVVSPLIYWAVGSVPLTLGNDVCGLLSVGLRTTPDWSEQDQQLLHAVARGLNLALERSAQTRRLEAQNTELAAQTRALEGVAQLSHDLALDTDPNTLIQRALELTLSLLPEGFGAFYERAGPVWRVPFQVGDGSNEALKALSHVSFPVGHTPSFDRPFETGEAFFQDVYDQTLELEAPLVQQVRATATLPVRVHGQVLGIFAVSLFEHHRWSAADRVLLSTTVRSLGLVIERSLGVSQLAEERRVLALTNEELEAFAYSASHDLRTPVRHVMSFTDLASKALITAPNEKASRYLETVQQAAGKMTELIDGMLLLSRAGRQAVVLRTVELNTLVAQVQGNLTAGVSGRTVDWQVGPLPAVTSDLDLLQKVLTHLLDNALKFSGTREPPRIQVWAEERGATWAIFVRDNGVGFDSTYQHKLFGVFQRLHSDKQFSGVGAGLATVRRIVIKLGGDVFAEGQVDQGATFSFTLPKAGAFRT